MTIMVHQPESVPRSCDLFGTAASGAIDDDGHDSGGRFVVWMIDDRATVVVRAATTLGGAVEVARA